MTEARPVPWIVNALGWYGTVAILAAYALSSFDLLEKGIPYQLLNLTGAAGVGLVCWVKRAWQPLGLEVAWALVAAVALVRTLL